MSSAANNKGKRCEHCSSEGNETSLLVLYSCWACGKMKCTHCDDCYEEANEEEKFSALMWFEPDLWLKDPGQGFNKATVKPAKEKPLRGRPITLGDFLPP